MKKTTFPGSPIPFSATAQPGAPPQLAVLCLSSSLGGLELNSLKFANWMQERGWRMTFIAPPGTPLAKWSEEWFVPLETLAVRRGLAMPLAAWALKQLLQRLRVDVLIVTQNKDLALATLVKTLMGNRLRIIYQQHMQLGRPKRSVVHTLRFRQVDAWLTPLPGLGREVVSLTHFDPKRLHIVPLGLPMQQFAPPTHALAEARQELGLPQGGHLLGVLGRFDDGKGQDFVIKALHHLRQQANTYDDVGLLLMGEPTLNEGDAYLRYLHELVAQLGLEQQVHFRGFRPDPAVFYRAIDVFVMASTSETYGMVTLEAMASGVPVVGAASGGTTELVQHDRTGLLYRLGDVEDCARALRHCFDDPAATHLRVERARLERWRYSHHRQCALTEDVIWALCAEPAATLHASVPRGASPASITQAFASNLAL